MSHDVFTPQPTALFRNLISYYIVRQSLVVLTMLDLAPLPLQMGGDTILGVEIKPYIERHHARLRHLSSTDTLYSGIWKGEWEYRVHGIGCALTHLRTGEPLEWDAPDPAAFRLDWFWEHLEWRVGAEVDDPFVEAFIRWRTIITESSIGLEAWLVEQNVMTIGIDGICKLKQH